MCRSCRQTHAFLHGDGLFLSAHHSLISQGLTLAGGNARDGSSSSATMVGHPACLAGSCR